MPAKQYDFIIVGGGAAGCALANRLSEDPNNEVLVLEAGSPDYFWDVFLHMPAGLTVPVGNRLYDWCYESEAEPFLNNRRIFHGRGKRLGGSSSIGGMIYVRGHRRDFDGWAEAEGMAGWDYAHCLPYFKKIETRPGSDPDFHGTDGPIPIEPGPCNNPLFEAFVAAAAQAGYDHNFDMNGRVQEGFGPFDRNIHRGRRWSAARAYLRPIRKRENLTIVCRALSSRLLLEGRRVVGVEYIQWSGSPLQAFGGTVISCGGAINSPQLLQLSGIGPAPLLRKVGVDIVRDLPGVGENLQDHLEVYIQHACKQPVSMYPTLQWWNRPQIAARWLLTKKGPAATNHFEAGGFLRSNAEVPYPNFQLHFLPLAIRYNGSFPMLGHGYQVHLGLTRPEARGSVRIKSTDPRMHPRLRFNYLSNTQDRRDWRDGFRAARDILQQPALAPFDAGEVSPGPQIETDSQILTWIADDAETALHPCGSCRMGTDERAVVDPTTMRVHGIHGLAVVDASVMPTITNGNILAPTMMVAERAADLLLGNEPLAPESPSTQEPESASEGQTGHL